MILFMVVYPVLSVAGFVIGLYLLVARPERFRSILRSLWALSYGIEAGISTFREHRQDRLGKTGKPVAAIGKAKDEGATLRQVLNDLKQALIGQGMASKVADRAVEWVDSELPGCDDFDILFRAVLAKKAA